MKAAWRALPFSPYAGFMETITFVMNSAFDFGGAIAVSNPLKLNVSDVNFASNKAEAGGAISVASAEGAAAEFQRCRFERNRGTRGGALYFNGEGKRWLQDSSLRLNVAGETPVRRILSVLTCRNNTFVSLVTGISSF